MSEANTALDQQIVDQESGAGVLASVEAFLGRFVAYPSEDARVAHTLWIGHAHMMDAWESTPRIAFLSPEPGSGKTRALEVTELLVPNPVEAVNVSPAYLFRKVGADEGPPTILFDEIDTVFGPKAKDNEEIRGLLNAGHRRGAVAGRCVVRGSTVETEEIPAYCAVALAGLDDLPDTIRTRSVIIRMRRRAPHEHVEPYRRRLHMPAGNALRSRLLGWAESIIGHIVEAWPEMPPGIEDRDADVWEPLLAVADAAGGDWPGRARAAAVALVAQSRDETPSLGIRLLSDLRDVFEDRLSMSTKTVLGALCEMEEAPWSDLRGKPLNERGLATRLRRYQVKSTNIRAGGQIVKGYTRESLHDVWNRYLGPSSDKSATSATAATTAENGAFSVADVAEEANSAFLSATQETQSSAKVADVADVALLPEANPCTHCGGPHLPDNPVSKCHIGEQQVWLHRACEESWLEGGKRQESGLGV